MTGHPVSEGEIAFDAPGAGKPCKTWYKVIGSLESSSSPPIVALHGGPGAGHEYMITLEDLYEKHGNPVMLYDQIGCGRSTHFREKMGDGSFWTFDLFIQELDNLVDHFKLREKGFHIVGQSWGGMLGAAYAALRPAGLKKLVIAGGPASMPLYQEGCKYLLSQLPPDVRKTIEDCERKGDYESPEYQQASAVMYARHFCRLDPMPEEVQAGFGHLKEDPTAYLTMQGPSEFTIVGTFKDWEGWKDAHNIEAETLLLNGRYDEARDLCMAPWFKHIPKVKWVTLEDSSHMTHWEQRDRFNELCGGFLVGS
ncbi:Alpha/Beta hydrolase protein [Xylariomycetidae sp. FL0641]|nr:Alpha/Beta hydrolase protein [Xylariomycetidae sp. FL0641]